MATMVAQTSVSTTIAPMMTGFAQFGAVEMGGMFTVLKVRRDQKPGDYRDPGWFRHPKGTVAYEWAGAALPEPARGDAAGASSMPLTAGGPPVEMAVRKPTGHQGH